MLFELKFHFPFELHDMPWEVKSHKYPVILFLEKNKYVKTNVFNNMSVQFM